jgi:DNA polymerase-3 subunit delta
MRIRRHRIMRNGDAIAMRITTDKLSRTLDRPLAPVWLVAGDEPLLVGEAADAIRARARAAGYAGRDLFFVERGFDWSALLVESQSLSLFAERRVIELRLPNPRPGKEGGGVLAKLASDPPPDTLLLVVTGRPERETYSTAWFKAFEKTGVVVQSWPVEIGQLPQWIVARAERLGLAIDAEGAQLLAERVEGNLLAAHQEIEMLALLHPGGRAGADDVLAAVANSARYDVFQLGEAALDGDAPRSLRILQGLRAEGAEPALVLWALCRELRALAAARRDPASAPVYGRQAEQRAALLARATRRTAGRTLAPLFTGAGQIDRQIKGLRQGDPWTALTGLVAELAGVALPAAPATWN